MNKAKMFHANRARMGAENIIDVGQIEFFGIFVNSPHKKMPSAEKSYRIEDVLLHTNS